MLASIINVILYSVFYINWMRSRRFDIGTMLIPALYLFTAIMCMNSYVDNPKDWQLEIFPFLYMFAVYYVLMSPLKVIAPKRSNIIENSIPPIAQKLVYLFIVFAVYYFLYIINEAIDAIHSGDWASIRNDLYWGDEKQYTPLQKVCLNGYSMMNILGEVYFFYCLAIYKYKKTNSLFLAILLCSIYLPEIFGAVAHAARGTLFLLVIRVFIIYRIFRNELPNKLKNILLSFSVVVLFLFIVLSIAITFSRFENDSSSSLLYYFGHSMNCFNYGVMDTTNRFLKGSYALGNYYDILFGIPKQIETGSHFGSSFVTVIGSLYIDFGPIFTLLIALFIMYLFKKKMCGNILNFPIVYLYMIYCEFLIHGVFTMGDTYGAKLIVKYFLFYIIFIFSKHKSYKLAT